MKKRNLSLALLLMLIVCVTGCGSSSGSNSGSSESVAEAIEAAVNEAIEAEYAESTNFYVSDIQERLPDDYLIVGVYSSSGEGILNTTDYIDPEEGLGAGQGGMSIVNTVDYLIIYDYGSSKEFRVRIFRTSSPPLASCNADSEIVK